MKTYKNVQWSHIIFESMILLSEQIMLYILEKIIRTNVKSSHDTS